jgi:KDEL-tailed cysteine endopeptidase
MYKNPYFIVMLWVGIIMTIIISTTTTATTTNNNNNDATIVLLLNIPTGLTNLLGGFNPDSYLPDNVDITRAYYQQGLIQLINKREDQVINAQALIALFDKSRMSVESRLNDLRNSLITLYGVNATSIFLDSYQTVQDNLLAQYIQIYFPSQLNITYNPSIQSVEWKYRAALLFLRYIRVLHLNKDNNGTARFKLGPLAVVSTIPSEWAQVTGFSYSPSEYPPLGLRRRRQLDKDNKRSLTVVTPTPAPSLDWRNAIPAVLAPIQNQGSCGSCWAFSAACVGESRFAILAKNLTQLSMQQLVSCDVQGGNMGCNGGNPITAYHYMYSNLGITSYEVYPYVSASGSAPACNNQDADLQLVQTGNTHVITATSDNEIIQGLQTGPVSILIVASTPCFHQYSGGVMMNANCPITNPPQLDHAIVIVGYTTMSTTTSGGAQQQVPVWIVRNSWGTSWGDSGYGYMERGVPYPGTLGCLSSATYPSIVELSVECKQKPVPSYCSEYLGVNPSSTNSIGVDYYVMGSLVVGLVGVRVWF